MIKIIYNGKIFLTRGNFCEAIIIKDGRVFKTGSSADILEMAPVNAEKVDADGALVLPAFHDSHLHLMWLGRRAQGIECAGKKSIEEIISCGIKTIAQLNPAVGTYIQGSGVDPDRFSEGEKRDLCCEDLDKISTEYPLVFSRHCGHTIYCNSLALKIAGLSESAPDIEGGTIEKDKNGKPTGVLRENATALVKRKMPSPTIEEMKRQLHLAMKKAHSAGITACGSYDVNGPDFENIVKAYCEVYDELQQANSLGLRVSMQCGISLSEETLDKHIKRYANGHLWQDTQRGTFLKMQSIKLFADGTLGGQTAWLRQPYCDNPNTSGFPLMEQDKLEHIVRKSSETGMQVLIHAIGDAGIDATLCAFEKVTSPGKNPLRHGIIHCQITSPDLLERMARNKILALVQPGFLADDIHILENRVGKELARTSYAWESMSRLGVPLSFSTDAPVCDINPFFNIEWALTRGGFYPNEKVDIYTCVDAYTKEAAFSSFDEDFLGQIKPDAYADLVFLDKDIFTVPAQEMQKTKVLRTMCAGETVYVG